MTSAEGPCFHKMKNTVSKMNGFWQNLRAFIAPEVSIWENAEIVKNRQIAVSYRVG